MPDIGSVTVQVLSAASGTYTPTANMLNVLAILIGGGAGGESGIATDEVAGGGSWRVWRDGRGDGRDVDPKHVNQVTVVVHPDIAGVTQSGAPVTTSFPGGL